MVYEILTCSAVHHSSVECRQVFGAGVHKHVLHSECGVILSILITHTHTGYDKVMIYASVITLLPLLLYYHMIYLV